MTIKYLNSLMLIISSIIGSYGFSYSNSFTGKPIIEEFKLGDSSNYNLLQLGLTAIQNMDSLPKSQLNFWKNYDMSISDNLISDSAKLVMKGYTFKSKSVKVMDSTDRQCFDIFHSGKLISQNVFSVEFVQIDPLVNSCLFQATNFEAGQFHCQYYFNDKKLNSDNLNINGVSPKLLNGKPLYIARGPSKNKTDSIFYFEQPETLQIWLKKPMAKMSYEFRLLCGTDELIRFEYPYSGYWCAFPENVPFKTLTFPTGWAFEFSEMMLINGINISRKSDYSECFKSWILNDNVFFFYKKDNSYSFQWGDFCPTQKYSKIFRNGCCEHSMFNPRFYKNKAVSFFALKENFWYLIIVHF